MEKQALRFVLQLAMLIPSIVVLAGCWAHFRQRKSASGYLMLCGMAVSIAGSLVVSFYMNFVFSQISMSMERAGEIAGGLALVSSLGRYVFAFGFLFLVRAAICRMRFHRGPSRKGEE